MAQPADLPLPENTEYIESVYKADKLIGCGNGMQYLGAILIRNNLPLEALKAYYSGLAEHEWECVVERQTSAEIEWVEYAGGLSFKTEVEEDDYYVAYSWGDSDSVFYAHGHPEEECQQKLTGARRASRGEGHSPTRFIWI